MHRVLCAGHVNWDVTLCVERLPEPDGEAVIVDQTQSGGGSAANTATVLTGLDQQATLLGSVGTDRYGGLVRDELQDAGVDCTHLQQSTGPTTVKYLLVDGDGRVMVLANEGVNEAFDAVDVPAATLASVSHVHLTSQGPETARELAATANDADKTVSFDPGRRLGNRAFDGVLPFVDLLFLNDEEATTATESALLTEFDGTVVVKQGAGGAELRAEGSTTTHPGFDVDPVDTAGAGDAFAAGFLTAWLDEQSSWDALAVGNACGAIAVTSYGARTRLSWKLLDPYLDHDR